MSKNAHLEQTATKPNPANNLNIPAPRRPPVPSMDLLDAMRAGGTFRIDTAPGPKGEPRDWTFWVDTDHGRSACSVERPDLRGAPENAAGVWRLVRGYLAAALAELAHERVRVIDIDRAPVPVFGCELLETTYFEIDAAGFTWQLEVSPSVPQNAADDCAPWSCELYATAEALLIEGAHSVDEDGRHWVLITSAGAGELQTWEHVTAWIDNTLAAIVLLDARPPIVVTAKGKAARA